MSYLFLAAFIAGLLLAVRIMFFGAERRRRPTATSGATPLRRSEPAGVAFLIMFGIAGYLLTRHGALSSGVGAGVAAVLGAAWAALVARIAIVMASVVPEHDPDDARFLLQGQVAVVTVAIPGEGEGTIAYGSAPARHTWRARAIDDGPIAEDLEVCIERIENGVAFVERWDLVEARV